MQQFIALLELDERDIVFQQDCAIAYTARANMSMMKDFFQRPIDCQESVAAMKPRTRAPQYFPTGDKWTTQQRMLQLATSIFR